LLKILNQIGGLGDFSMKYLKLGIVIEYAIEKQKVTFFYYIGCCQLTIQTHKEKSRQN